MVRSRPYILKTVENYPMQSISFFKGQEISYNISKIWLSTTIFTAGATFKVEGFLLNFVLFLRKTRDLKG